MNLHEHKVAIEAAVKAAEAEGFLLELSNPCGGCCSEYEVTLTRYVAQPVGFPKATESADVNL
ncbi:hypothetical protein [Streptomyces sp. NBC_01500]|uniref:hypothetical protein n=1 Tax=Streptomyces sp. NBC_01500 TaxID=2903886 RepID=UPI002255E429|nr:hypothetical protein [Streptomyces sp. NBC_01500]MCX4554158.1 hypothetical protein [Streptomyces sp. NBC_01500]